MWKTNANVLTCKVLSISDVILKYFRVCLRTSGTTLAHLVWNAVIISNYSPMTNRHILWWLGLCHFSNNSKRHNWAATWQNQQHECAPSEDSDQPGHPPSLIRVFTVTSMGSQWLKLSSYWQRRLWSEHSQIRLMSSGYPEIKDELKKINKRKKKCFLFGNNLN